MTLHLTVKPAGTPTWIDVLWPDAAAARAFYHALFGWEFSVGSAEFGGYATGTLGKHMVAGVVGGAPPGAPPMPATWNVHFATHDIHADTARAVALGANVIYPPMVVAGFGGLATLADPTGAPFSLWQADSHTGFQVSDEPNTPAWFELYTHDLAASTAFFTALLNATSTPMPGGMQYNSLQHGESQLIGIMQIEPSWGAMAPNWAVYFAVADTDATVANILALGGKQFGPIDDSPFGRLAAVADAAGATFKIIKLPTAR
jgi:uncharacterized protein